MNKSELRQLIRERKRQYSNQALEQLSLAVVSRLMNHPRVQQASTLLLYYSLPDEVNTHECIEQLYRMGKTILLPKVIDDGIMEIRHYTGAESMQLGAFNIMEPTGDLSTDYAHINLAIVPGMSFDPSGNRLGRGKGYYDRFLVQVPQLYKIGMCFDFQKVAEVPYEKTDIRMNEVL
ncbi:MAG: 5-formyltetrahydrofolate cyclo-ligase [Prevotella sp.]|nr:5-formyltetrahydrofolate cyclo-ligase [Prevotella sp.]